MKNPTTNKFDNKHDAIIATAEKEILLVYDLIKVKGKIPAAGLVNKQIVILRRHANTETGFKYLFTCC